jgi:hypothetical protein
MKERLDRRVRGLLGGDGPVYAVAVLVTTVITAFAYNLGRLTWRVPISYRETGDAVFYMGFIKTDLETGWYERQPRLGAPFGQVFHDFKTAENLPHVFIDAIGLFGADFGTAMNVYYLLGFPLSALTAVWFMRLVGMSRSMSAVTAVLFALAPYHFIRGQLHMWLAEYWTIPLALGVVVLIAAGRPVWGRRHGHGRLVGWLTGRTAGTLAALALVAATNSYYALWTLQLIAVAGLARFVATRDLRAFGGAVVAGIWTCVFTVANMLPDMVYGWVHGANATAVQRLPMEVEIYSLKLSQLVLPVPYHRIGVLRALRGYYDQHYPLLSEEPVLGAVAALGFVIALVVAVYALLAPRRRAPHSNLRVLAGLTLVTFLIGTVGGISTLLSFFTSDLRGANRISIVIALFCLGIVGLAVDAAVGRATRDSRTVRAKAMAGVVAIAVLVVGSYDQVPPRTDDYALDRAAFDHDQKLVGDIESAVPKDAKVLQLPYFPFPEYPDVNGASYADQLMPFLHSRNLRWSGAAIKGRPKTEWVRLGTESLGWTGLVSAATLAGFDGVLLDTQAFATPGEVPTAELTELLGAPRVSDDRYSFFTTQQLRSTLTAVPATVRSDVVERVLHPTLVRWAPDFSHGFTFRETLQDYRPRFELDNARDEATTVELRFDMGYRDGARLLRFRFPDGSTEDVRVSMSSRPVTLRFEAPPGRSTVEVSVLDGAQPPNLSGADDGPIRVMNVKVSDPRLVSEVAGLTSAADR